MTNRRKKTHKRLNIALIGCGRASADHLKAIYFFEKRRFVELRAIVDKNEQAIESVLASRSSQFKRPIVSDNIDDVLEKAQIDLTVIATPPASHFPLAVKALDEAREALRLSEVLLDSGKGILLDVTTSQESLTRAQLALSQADYDILETTAQLMRAVGSDDLTPTPEEVNR